MSILIRDLTLVYGSGPTAVSALSGLELEVADGELCIVRGPNGSGKTSLIRVLTGEIAPTAGQVRVSNADTTAPRIAVVRQFDELQDALTVAEHFELFADAKAAQHLDAQLLARRVSELAAGERRIVALALAMSTRPDVLLADEPTGALPWLEAEALLHSLALQARERDVTVLLVSHDTRAEFIADRVVSLSDGRISAEWRPGDEPRQVVDGKGWLHLPKPLHDGLDRLLSVEATSTGVALHGVRVDIGAVDVFAANPRELGAPLLWWDGLSCERQSSVVFTEVGHEVRQGGRTIVRGASGSGKTTLLEVLAGLRHPIAGEVHWSDATPDSAAAMFSMDLPFAQHSTLRELVPDRSLLDGLQLAELADRELRTLSGGQQQRALLAIALAHPAQVVLLDEPTSALDEANASRVVDVINASDKTFVIATHDPRLLGIATDELVLG